MRVWKGPQWGKGGPPECLAAVSKGVPAQADIYHVRTTSRGCLAPRASSSQEGQRCKRKVRGTWRCLLAPSWSQLPWVGPPSTKEARPQILKRLDSTEMGRAPKTRWKPGYTGSRHRDELGQVFHTDCPWPWFSFFWFFSQGETTQLICQLLFHST